MLLKPTSEVVELPELLSLSLSLWDSDILRLWRLDGEAVLRLSLCLGGGEEEGELLEEALFLRFNLRKGRVLKLHDRNSKVGSNFNIFFLRWVRFSAEQLVTTIFLVYINLFLSWDLFLLGGLIGLYLLLGLWCFFFPFSANFDILLVIWSVGDFFGGDIKLSLTTGENDVIDTFNSGILLFFSETDFFFSNASLAWLIAVSSLW